MSQFRTFKDLSVTFKKHPVTDDLITVKNKTAIAQSIKALLLTNPGERPFQPNLGSGLRDVLFEPLDYGTAALIKKSIREVISTYEPRIRVQNIRTRLDSANNGYDVSLQYSIVGREDKAVGVEFFLERTR
tara:strand:+ start:45 stop:437 length:393 start_codon:yes stop_codon:yes gene_type:complete